MRCSQPGKKAFCPLHVLPASLLRVVLSLPCFLFICLSHPGYCRWGGWGVGVTSYRSPTVERTASGARPDTLAASRCWQQRWSIAVPAFLCLLWEFAGIYCTDTYVVMAAAAAIVHEGGRKKEQKGEGDGEFSKRHRKCGREARGARNTESSIDPLLSSTLTSWPHSRAPLFVFAHTCVNSCVWLSAHVKGLTMVGCASSQQQRRTSSYVNLCPKKKKKTCWIFSIHLWTLVPHTLFTLAASYR